MSVSGMSASGMSVCWWCPHVSAVLHVLEAGPVSAYLQTWQHHLLPAVCVVEAAGLAFATRLDFCAMP